MTDQLDPRDPRERPTTPAEPIDDLALAALVREVADDWRMPPQRLDAPTWRDRVGTGPRRPWLGRLVRAGTLALVATLGLSLAAVWLSLPTRGPTQAGATPAASGPAGTPGATDRPSPSPLPKLALTGDPPTTTTVLVRVGPDYALADLTSGKLGPRITGSSGASTLRQLPDGRLACLCVDTDGYVAGAYTHAVVSLRTYDRTGAPLERFAVGDYTGAPDPRPGTPEDMPPHVDVSVSWSADGRLGFVGWSARQPPVWKAGIVVVDLAAGRVVQRVALPDVSTGPDSAVVQAFGPSVTVSTDGNRVLITRSSYSIVTGTVIYHGRSDHYLANLEADRLGTPAAFAGASGCPEGQSDAGFGADGRVWLGCVSDQGRLSIRLLDADGSPRDETQLGGLSSEGGILLATRDGTALYSWAPETRVVTRLDLVGGGVTTGTAPAPTGNARFGPLAAIGRWLAPPAAAKVFLQPGLVLSPDGSRLYALGIAAEAGGIAGSTGVFSFDSKSLAPLGNWSPTADFISLAISPDGQFVYAAGAPGVNSAGQEVGFAASITVYDTADGSVRLLAGQLEADDLSFPGPILP